MIKVLVTGANGFIGKQLCNFLEKSKHIQLTKLVRNPTKKNEQKFPNYPQETFSKVMSTIQPRVVIHLAGIAHSKRKESEYELINNKLTQDLAIECEKNKSHLIFLSTIKVYGDNTFFQILKTTPTNPEDFYSISKLNAENYIKKLNKENQLRFTIIRPALVYGENFKGNLKKLTLYAKSSLPNFFPKEMAKREMLSISLLNQTINEILRGNYTDEIVNLSDPEQYSAFDIIELYRAKNKTRSLRLSIPHLIWRLCLPTKIYNKIFSPLSVETNNKISHHKKLYEYL